MIERNDFSNFQVFYECYKNNKLILEKLIDYKNILNKYNDEKNNKNLYRYFYVIIYECYYFHENEERKENLKIIELEDKEDSVFSDSKILPISQIIINKEEKLEKEIKSEEQKANDWDIDDKFIFS